MSELVSVIMPAYNAEKYIAESITSVINQTYTNWELLIVDDGSTDNTKAIIKNFCNQDLRINYFYQINGKQGKARNLAIVNAKGNFIAFLDADDIWMPQKLSVQLEEINGTKADLVFSECFIIKDCLVNESCLMQSGKGFFSGETGLRSFLEMNKIPVLSVLIKAKVLNNANGFSEKPTIQNVEDYDLWLRLLMNGCILYGSNLVLAGYREHTTSSTVTDKLSISRVIEAFEDLKNNHSNYRNLLNEYQKKWFKRYHYSTSEWSKENYKQLLKNNCYYLNKPLMNIFFQATYAFFGLKIARKLINKFVNVIQV